MISPPVHTRHQELPFGELTWLNFEKLCLRLVRLDQSVEHTDSYGTQGNTQDGIDIYARHRGSNFYSTYQCKNVKDFGPAKIEGAVDVFLQGEWVKKSDKFFLCTREALKTPDRINKVEEQTERLKRHKVTLVIWDEGQLSARLKDHPKIVDDFFDRPWVAAFNGPDAADRLGDRITATQSEAAMTDYHEWLDKKWGKIVYRGFSGRLTTGRNIELPLNQVYIPPHLLAETQRAPEEQRERRLLALLDDPDSDGTRHADWERELNAFKGSAWHSSPPHHIGWRWHDQMSFSQDNSAPMELDDVLRAHRRAIVLGAPGSGKSTLLRWLAVQCTYSHLHPQETGRITSITDDTLLLPILLSLASYAAELVFKPSLSLIQFLTHSLSKLNIPNLERLFTDEWEAGRCWVLLDGIDEIKSATVRAKVVREAETLLAACNDNRCLFSSRVYGYERLSGVPTFYLRGFDSQQIGLFVRNWHWSLELELRPDSYDLDAATDRARELLAQLNESDELLPLAANPLILVAMLLLYEQRRELPRSRVELYEATVETLLETWNRWRGEALYDAGGQTLSPIQMRRMLGVIALWSRREKPRGIWRRSELVRHIVAALQELGSDTDAELTAQSYLDAAVGEAGLLEERSPGFFAFWHSSFEEFLAADALARDPALAKVELVARRPDNRWREVTLFTVGILGVVKEDGEDAADLVRALAHTALDITEPVLHNALRLALACLAEAPTLPRALVQELVSMLVRKLKSQPYDLLSAAFEQTAQALPHFKPDDSLVKSLRSLIENSMCAIEVLALMFRWLANVAPSNAEALMLCRKSTEIVAGNDVPMEIVMLRFYATIGVVRAGEISGPNLALLVWHRRTIGFVAEVVELLGLGPNSDELAPVEKERRLEQIRAVVNTPIPDEDPEDSDLPNQSSALMSALAGTLILLFAGERSSDIVRVLEEALQPKHDDCGAVFDAAHACRAFDFEDRELVIRLHRLAVVAQRRWLHHRTPYREYHAALMLLDLVDEWEDRFGQVIERDTANQGRVEEVKAEKFAGIYDCSRHDLRKESLECLRRCLNELDFWFQLEVADALLQQGELETVLLAVDRWLELDDEEFPKLSMRPLIDRIKAMPEGHETIVGWLHGDNEWLRLMAVGSLMGDDEFADETLRPLLQGLDSRHDEVRSVSASVLMMTHFKDKTAPPEVERALRSCLGSQVSDASRHAAAALYQSNIKDDAVMSSMIPYLKAPQLQDRFDAIRAFQNSPEGFFAADFAKSLGLGSRKMERACEDLEAGRVSPGQLKLLIRLIEVQKQDTEDIYSLRRCCHDWLCVNLQRFEN